MREPTHPTITTPISVTQAARLYRLSPRTLRSAIAEGTLPAYRPGSRKTFVYLADLDLWLRSHRVEPTPLDSQHAAAVVAQRLDREARRSGVHGKQGENFDDRHH